MDLQKDQYIENEQKGPPPIEEKLVSLFNSMNKYNTLKEKVALKCKEHTILENIAVWKPKRLTQKGSSHVGKG